MQKIDNLAFPEAVERLAARARIELRYEQGGHVPGQEQSQRRRLLEAHQRRRSINRRDARGGRRARGAVTASRGFEQSDAEHFGVGYAPAGWDALVRHLRGRGFTDAN